jgi:phage terminase large subunit-like protein
MNEKYNRKLYYNYVDGVLSGTIPACKAVVLACQRFRNWQARTDMYFDEAEVDKRIKLIYLMRHYQGIHNGKHFRLLDWQQFAVANIFGWKWKSNGLRVTKKVFIMVSRKNGKTALAAAINLCTLICDHENGAEIYCVANNAKQASIGLTHTQNFAESIDPGKKVFRNYRNEIKMPKTKSIVQVLSSDAMGNDEVNPTNCQS